MAFEKDSPFGKIGVGNIPVVLLLQGVGEPRLVHRPDRLVPNHPVSVRKVPDNRQFWVVGEGQTVTALAHPISDDKVVKVLLNEPRHDPVDFALILGKRAVQTGEDTPPHRDTNKVLVHHRMSFVENKLGRGVG